MNREWLIPVGILAGMAVVVAAVWVALPARAVPAFKSGQMVRTVIGNRVGQVIWTMCGERCVYDVRFDAMEIHSNTRVLSGDDPVTLAPLSLVRGMREFELRPTQ